MFTDAAQLGGRNIVVTDELKEVFVSHINGRMECTEFISSMSVFDPHHAKRVQPNQMEGMSQPDIDIEETESGWKFLQ